MRNIEENIVFASTRKMLGLGKVFDEKLVELQVKATPRHNTAPRVEPRAIASLGLLTRSDGPRSAHASRALQENVVEKFDVLDLFEAKSTMQVDAFSFGLSMGVFAVGMLLMNMEVTDDNPAWTVAIPSICLGMQGTPVDPVCFATAEDGVTLVQEEPEKEMRVDLPTLFAYASAVQGIFPICSTFIGCIRKIQVGMSSYARVRTYINEDPEPWEDHALTVQTQKTNTRTIAEYIERVEAGKKAGPLPPPATVLVEVTVPFVPKKDFGMYCNVDGVVIRLTPDGMAYNKGAGGEEGLQVGDRILEVNGSFMDGLSMNPINQPIANCRGSQISTALVHLCKSSTPPRKVDFLVTRLDANAEPLPVPWDADGDGDIDENDAKMAIKYFQQTNDIETQTSRFDWDPNYAVGGDIIDQVATRTTA